MTTSIDERALTASQDQVLHAAEALVAGNVLSLSQHGNISVRLPSGDAFVLTGGGTLDNLTRDDLALLDLYGTVLRGSLSPTAAEIIQMHAAIYRKRDDVGAVIHTHSPNATAFALASRPIPPVYEAMIRFDITEPVPVAAYGPRGSERSVQNILDVIGPRTQAVLLANHGSLVFARDIATTVRLVFILEEAAEMVLKAQPLGGAQPIPPELFGETLHRRDAFAPAESMPDAGAS